MEKYNLLHVFMGCNISKMRNKHLTLLTYDVKQFFGVMSVNTGSPKYSKLFLVVPVKLSTSTMMVATPSVLSGVLQVMNSLQDDKP